MALRFKRRIICVCLEEDGISLIPTELQIELGQSRPPGMDQKGVYLYHLLFT